MRDRLRAVTTPATTPLRTALTDLANRVEAVPFDLPSPDQGRRRETARRVVWSVREYLQPRLADLDAPAIAALIGSTGAGKSTLMNSFAQAEVSRPGAVRPTTRVPVVWTHRDHGHRYAADLLPAFAAADRPMRVVTHADERLRGVTVVDTPDLDSVVTEHRALADDLLAAADLCIWVTTAQRYADAVPWDVLRGVRDRGLPLLVVLNRIPERGADRIADDLRRRLVEQRVLAAEAVLDLVTIPEGDVDPVHGGLAPGAVAAVRSRLADLAEPEARRRLVADALRSGLGEVLRLATRVQEELATERAEGADLAATARTAYEQQREELVSALADGRLIHGEVVERWQQYVGTGELLRVVTEGAGRLRGWVRQVFGGTERARTVQGQARSELAAAITRRADRAATNTAGSWELSPTGAALLEGTQGTLWRSAAATQERADALVDEWLAGITALVEQEGGDRRRVAQIASAGVNGVAVTLLLAVFAQTGGLTGAEVGITAGAAALQQRLLEHVFGSAAARRLVAEARIRLERAAGELLVADRQRFDDLVTGTVASAAVEEALADATARVRTEATALLEELDRG